MAHTAPKSMTLLNNRYQTIQVLGAGGFGETFLAEDTYMPSRRRCVIKQLKPIINDPQMHQLIQQMFQREAANLESLGEGSDQIPNLYAYFSENGQFYLVQEWIQGPTLRSKVETEGPLSERAVREILVSLLQVLDYVHSKRIIYRDIKPDNIILRQSNSQPVLIDFGAVKETMTTYAYPQGKTTHSIVLGTPGFMAPEQATGRPIYASDIYSLGTTAIYLLTGILPQELEIDSQTDQILWQRHALQVSPALTAVLDKAIQYHPRDRYTTATKMLNDLQSVASIPQRPPSTETILLSPAKKKESNQPAQVSPQPVVINHPSRQGKWQKALLLGSLLVVGLIGAIVVGPIVTSPPLQSTSEQPIATTPAVDPAPASEPAEMPPTSVTQSPSPVIPALQQVPGFPTGTSERRVKAALGNPTNTSRGIWPNTRAVLYELKSNQVTLGYLVDRNSGQIRQTEASFAQSVKLEVMQATLQEMLGDRTFINISQGLQQVYQRRTNNYSFNTGALKGVIERNDRDRIYIGVWDADLH